MEIENELLRVIREARNVKETLAICGMDYAALTRRLQTNRKFMLDWSNAMESLFSVEERKQIALDVYSTTGRTEYAFPVAGYVTRSALYNWRKNDKAFADKWEQARAALLDTLEDEAYRRAVEGVEEPIYYRGTLVGSVRKYSDQLLILLLKANAPQRYREYSRVELAEEPKLDDATAAAKLSALMEAARRRRDGDDLA